MIEWVRLDIFLMFFFAGLLFSGYVWNSKNKKVAMAFCIAAVVVIVFVLSNILYFTIVKAIFT